MKREISDRLVQWKNSKTRLPLIIKGARQVGKTYTLQEFGREHFPRCLYVNFEEDEALKKIFEPDLKPRRILDELSFHTNASIDAGRDLLIFDEIQVCPRALTSLKYFSEKMPELAVCCAGSLLGLHFGHSSFPVGKVDFLEMYPMSFREFLLGIGEQKAYDFLVGFAGDAPVPDVVHSRLWELLKIYFIVGGLPGVVNVYRENKPDRFAALGMVRKKQNNLLLSYEADMAKHSGKQNSMHINRLWRSVPAQLAKEQDGSASKFVFKDVIPGVKGYPRLAGIIDWLSTAGLIIKTHIINKGLLPFSAYAAENFFKLYFFDVGVLGAISKLPPRTILDYDYGSYKGYVAENFAAQEFLTAGDHALVGWKEGNAEVEFLKEVNGKIFPIEIKSGWVTQAKSSKVFVSKYSPDYRVIMSAKNLRIDTANRVHHYPLYLASRFPVLRDKG